MLSIALNKIDELMEIGQELNIISYLQKLVNHDYNAQNLNISEKMQSPATDYLIDLNAQTVEKLYSLIMKEDFTVSLKTKIEKSPK